MVMAKVASHTHEITRLGWGLGRGFFQFGSHRLDFMLTPLSFFPLPHSSCTHIWNGCSGGVYSKNLIILINQCSGYNSIRLIWNPCG